MTNHRQSAMVVDFLPQQPSRQQLLLILLLLVADGICHNDHNAQEDRQLPHHGLGDFTDEDAEVSNPFRSSDDFLRHKE